MYQAAVPTAQQVLRQVAHLLSRTPEALLGARLHADMFDLATQVQITCGFTLRATYVLVGLPIPEAEFDNDRDGLLACIAQADAALARLTPADFDGLHGYPQGFHWDD